MNRIAMLALLAAIGLSFAPFAEAASDLNATTTACLAFTPSSSPKSGGECLRYVEGFLDGSKNYAIMLRHSELEMGKTLGYCLPPGTTAEQVALAFGEYLRGHPAEARNPLPSIIFTHSLGIAFPCEEER